MIDFGFDLAGQRDPRLIRGLVLASIGAALEASPLLVAFLVVDQVLSGQPTPLSAPGLALLFATLMVAAFAIKLVGSRDNFAATYELVCRTRLRLIEHLQQLPMGFWSERRTGSTVGVLTDEFALYTEVVTHSWSLVVANAAMPLAVGGVLLWADPGLGLIALVPVPLAALAIPWSFRLVNRAGDRAHAQRRACVDALVEYVQGAQTLRALNATGTFRERLDALLAELERKMMRAELAPAPAVLSYSLLVFSGLVLLLVAGAVWATNDHLAPGRFVVVAVLGLHFARTLSELVVYLAASRHAARTLERMRDLFALKIQPEGSQAPSSLEPQVVVENVAFAYEDQPTLRGINLSIAPGTVTALVGPSGSGKSTLAHLLTRLWDVDDGSIKLGGVDLRDLTLAKVQQMTAAVFQDVVLFEDTVLENIRLGRPDASLEEVEQAARAARAHEFIMTLPDGYDTLLETGGRNLSGGQRQRLSIARALLKDAPILILDEATASVDLDEERLIQEAIAALMRGRTVVVVAHRLWTVQHADQIVVLEQGEIVERGRHRDLLEQEGLYHTLWELQVANRGWKLHKTGAQAHA